LESFSTKLTRIRELSDSTRDFRFIADRDVEFEPGQFYRFTFADEQGQFERSYSLCNFLEDATGPVMDLVISTVSGGRASDLLFSASPGLSARVTGPFGRLVLPKEMPQRLFLVATSVGIAPFMPMLESLQRRWQTGETTEVYFLYGTRDHHEFVYGDMLTGFAAANPGFHLHLCVSRCEPDKSLAVTQTRGYVQDALFSMQLDPATDHILLCGNPKMIDDCYPKLKDMGFGVRQVVREKYVYAKDKTTQQSAAKTMSEEQKALLAEKMKKYQK
jgi:ferredoxin-NADP reductase